MFFSRDVARIFGFGGKFWLKFEPTFFEAKTKFRLKSVPTFFEAKTKCKYYINFEQSKDF